MDYFDDMQSFESRKFENSETDREAQSGVNNSTKWDPKKLKYMTLKIVIENGGEKYSDYAEFSSGAFQIWIEPKTQSVAFARIVDPKNKDFSWYFCFGDRFAPGGSRLKLNEFFHITNEIRNGISGNGSIPLLPYSNPEEDKKITSESLGLSQLQ